MIISRSCKSHIQWWIDNLKVIFKLISHGKPKWKIFTDRLGAYDKTKDLRTGGHWSKEEQDDHIKVLELRVLGGGGGAKALCGTKPNTHIQFYCDNTLSCEYLRIFRIYLNVVAIDIWIGAFPPTFI